MPWQPAAIIYPDIELALTGRIRAALAARPETYAAEVYVANTVPNPRRDRMVIVRRDGGTQTGVRDRPRVSLRIWATSEKEANDLARLVIALCQTFADGAPVLAVPVDAITGPTPIPDESGQPMRYVVAEFHTRGVPA